MSQRRVGMALATLALAAAGCQVQEEVVVAGQGERAERGSVDGREPGSSPPGSDEPAVPPGSSARIMAPAQGEPAPIRLVVHPVEAEQGEDGQGARVEARRPVALDLVSAGWPGRAADPVLRVGPLVFREYEHPEPSVLRYVVADGGTLPSGAEVVLQYGDDVGSRVVVTQSLEVPR